MSQSAMSAGTAVVLEVLAQRLEVDEVEALCGALPPRLARCLREGRYVGDFDLEELILRVAGRAQVTRAMAAEYVATVCRSVAETITPEALQGLRAQLPDRLARLFPPGRAGEIGSEYHLIRRHHSLAEARPGSDHPLSEARPPRAHSESVARSDNPHADTKLSSATGLLQEREREAIATGRPGSERPLSERR